MSLKPFKFVIQAVLLEMDGERIVSERPLNPETVYAEKIEDAAKDFDAALATFIKESVKDQ